MIRNFDRINASFPEFAGRAKEVVYEEPVVNISESSEVDKLLDAIYALDPKTNLPTGDYAMLMSEKCSPELRDFIKNQLMGVITDVESTHDVPDDVLMELTRGKHETIYEYTSRVTEYAEQNKLLLQKESKLNKD